MFNFLYTVAENGLDILQPNADKISPLEWVEVLLSYPQTEEIIPWNSLDGEAWHTLLCEDPKYAKYVRWEKINKRRKKSLAKIYPEMEIPPIPALPGLDKDSQIQRVSPFHINCRFSAMDVNTKESVSSILDLWYFVQSLQFDFAGFADILTCGHQCCAGCAGFWSQSVLVKKNYIHWSIRQYEHEYELYFERKIYERSAIQHLFNWNAKRMGGRLGFGDNKTFENALLNLLEKKPHLQAYWQKLEDKNTKQR